MIEEFSGYTREKINEKHLYIALYSLLGLLVCSITQSMRIVLFQPTRLVQ